MNENFPNWRKSSRCNGNSACVEFRALPDGGMELRDSKDPNGPVLGFTRAEWDAFLDGAKDGEFDVDALAGP